MEMGAFRKMGGWLPTERVGTGVLRKMGGWLLTERVGTGVLKMGVWLLSTRKSGNGSVEENGKVAKGQSSQSCPFFTDGPQALGCCIILGLLCHFLLLAVTGAQKYTTLCS